MMPTRVRFLYEIARLLDYARDQEIQLVCFYFHRSDEEQARLVAEGKSRVQRSKHQDWLAMDFALFDDLDEDGRIDQDEIRWKDDPRYTRLGEFWEALGGRWGGRWKDPYDPYHFEAGREW
jgi:hypothetical protein